MKRDEDFLREFLLEWEANEEYRILVFSTNGMDAKEEKTFYHAQLAADTGLITRINPFSENSLYRLTSEGHDYLDAIRDENRWNEVKKNASAVGGSIGLDLLKKLAVGLLKTKVEEHTGVKL